MVRDMGISTITVCGLLVVCLSSSVLIANEFERQTVLAVLCKPIKRTSFILGKYLGIVTAASILILCQGMVLEIALIINKYARISSHAASPSGLIDYVCLLGIYLSLLHILIFTAISLVLSIYLNATANITICLLFFVFCNSFGYILPFENHGLSLISIITSICYIIFPNLQNLNPVAISEIFGNSATLWQKGEILQYIVYNSVYTIIYSIAIVWMAVVLLNRKEIT